MNLLMPENQHLPWRKGFPSTIPGELCDMWQDPKLIPLKLPVPIEFIESHITRFQNEILKENNKNLFIPSNSIILFPTMSTKNNIIPNSMWLKLSEISKEKGYTVFTNISGKNRYDEYIVENTQPINLNYEELAKLAILNPGTRYIMLRSGISDFLRLFGGTALIFYPSEPTWYWGNCKMSHVKYSKMLSTEIIFTGNVISEEPLAKALLEDFLN
jgi:hypothetical protein